MKPVVYQVYIHLDQGTGDVCYAQCNCKAGQGGSCKHIAALLYTLVDFYNMELLEVHPDLSRTQTGQNGVYHQELNKHLKHLNLMRCALKSLMKIRRGKGSR